MAATLMGWAFLFAPTGAFTLEANVIFSTYALALAYAQNDATAVAGKVISVISGNEAGVYMIESVGAEGKLKRVGSDIDLSNYVTKEQLSNIYAYKGTVENYEALLSIENPQPGFVYNVEAEVTLEEGLSSKVYPAGTNWAYNGSGWDALAGAIDLSGYQTKVESQLAHEAINESISALDGKIVAANLRIDGKVDAVDGHSLISDEKLGLIDSNASNIAQLQAVDSSLDSRLKVIEGAFTGGGDIDLGDLTSQVTDHSSRIVALETDNDTNKSDIGTLKVQVQGHGERLTAIEQLNTEQADLISGLTERVSAVEAYGTSISNLTNVVNGHTADILDVKSSIEGLAIKSVQSGDKILSADNSGVLSTTLGLSSYKNDSGLTFIKLTGIEGALISEFDASEFVKDGMIDSVVYDSDTKEMTITWNTSAGKDAVVIPMSGLVDVYTAGEGLTVVANEFSVKLDSSDKNKLSVSSNGLLVDISAEIASLESKIDNKVTAAFDWNIVE